MWGQVNEALPSPVAENTRGPVRIDKYHEIITRPVYGGQFGPAEEGQYFTACNPTPGTQVDFVTSAAVSETAGYYFVMKNSDSPSGTNRRIIMDYIRLICTSVPTAGTRGDFFIKVGPGNRYVSTGTLLTPQNCNSAFGNASIALPYIGACVTVADPAARLLCRGVLRAAIPVALDEFYFCFAPVEGAGTGLTGGTAPLRMTIPCPPVIVAPGHSLGLQLWFASNNAASKYEFECGWWER
jgi:hypothetical protein